MAEKLEPKPFFPLKRQFVESLDRFVHEAGLLANAVRGDPGPGGERSWREDFATAARRLSQGTVRGGRMNVIPSPTVAPTPVRVTPLLRTSTSPHCRCHRPARLLD
jgi:hypothetical protein